LSRLRRQGGREERPAPRPDPRRARNRDADRARADDLPRHRHEGVDRPRDAAPRGASVRPRGPRIRGVDVGHLPRRRRAPVRDLEAIGITASPCGGCRQWLFEFRFERVAFANTHGDVVSYRPEELLPETWELPG